MNRALRLLAVAAALQAQWGERETAFPEVGGFHFVRLEYRDLPGLRRFGSGRGWWRQDWPEADAHFAQGVRRLTRIDNGVPIHLPLTDDRIFDHPWIYATQVGYWDLSEAEVKQLREYLNRGGFLVTDDFYGDREWEAFRETMARVFPERTIVDIPDGDPVLHVVYDITERTFIPGLRHLRRGADGLMGVSPQAMGPQWRAIYDEKGRMVVAVNFNQDVGDAWEHADMPEYPEKMTALAYRFGINYILYAMTH